MTCSAVRFFFFFSSRRRHTRFKCDWSSDVCSSDLRCRAHLVSWLLEWRMEVIVATGIVISGIYGLWEYIREIDPLIVSLGVVVVFAVLMFGLNQGHKLYVRLRKPKSIEAPSTRPTKFEGKSVGQRIETAVNFADSTPDLRVADDRLVIALFDGDERDKLLPLLEAEKVTAWARPMGRGEPPLTKLSGQLWKTHYLLSLPREGQWNRAQTFLKTKARNETSYYDLYLNEVQIASLWPEYEKISLLEHLTKRLNR